MCCKNCKFALRLHHIVGIFDRYDSAYLLLSYVKGQICTDCYHRRPMVIQSAPHKRTSVKSKPRLSACDTHGPVSDAAN